MTLRARVTLLVVAVTCATVLAFGSVVLGTFERQLWAQLETVLSSDLERVALLLEQPTLGASFGGPASAGVTLEFVAADGTVALAWGDGGALPSVDGPTPIERDGRRYLVAQVPWIAAGGWVRMAHDVTVPAASVASVRWIVLATGLTVVLVAAALALAGAGRILGPLSDVARQTRDLDPVAPAGVTYRGPRDEVFELTTSLNGALGAIRERRERERAFLLEVAHELAAPLTLVDYHLDRLRRRDQDDHRLRAAADAARELLRTSQDLLALARGELQRELTYEVLDLGDVTRRVADEYPGVRTEFEGRAEVFGDPERLKQAIRNLVRNAVQASGGTDGVRVVLTCSDARHVLRVHDVGRGMPPEAIQRAFEHGFSGATGVGVGLSVAKDIIERHGGSVRVVASSTAGTVMEAVLPDVDARLTREGDVRLAVPKTPDGT